MCLSTQGFSSCQPFLFGDEAEFSSSRGRVAVCQLFLYVTRH